VKRVHKFIVKKNLKSQLAAAKQEIERLRAKLEFSPESDSPKSESVHETPFVSNQEFQEIQPTGVTNNSPAHEKIALFRSLFRGREDVYPRRWESKSGKAGYSPACPIEWDPVLCNKQKAKCTNCQYLPVTDQVIYDHLAGKHTIGVYPLLQDEICWFLAVDFDKASWQKDVGVFLETCKSMNVPAALERSRSGNGGHVWFFFAAPVAASQARKMGSALLTLTMQRRHQLGLDSYDRLFPNQDTMPKGGFGNLIADEKRNDLIFDDLLTALENGRSPLLLTERTEHLNYFAGRLKGIGQSGMGLVKNH